MKKPVIALALIASLSACAQQGGGYGSTGSGTGLGTSQTTGAVGGAILGGLAGSRFGGGTGKLVAVGAGTLLGAFLGSEVGKSLERTDVARAETATQQAYAAPIGQTIQWNNPETGAAGTVTPTREGRTQTGEYCREFAQTINVGGRIEQATGTACQQPDGTWRIVS
ncbi:RT0821/Lpp0805 family surface protein [Arenibaculum pallidiluteum]|uniref:RT0821/Lpp0805 family surface protein n=1 Tax=Arenibaculum pallidiluteum TaxID=2812559 RepID=UPI001A96E86E|nr:RT0821/Lpp0805 family surface protein [Arenibaculum pallidiluteum]